MANGNDPNNPYPNYPPPGGPGVQGVQPAQAHPQATQPQTYPPQPQGAAVQGPPPGYQPPQQQPLQQQFQPPQQQAPQGVPQQAPGQQIPGLAAPDLPPELAAAVDAEKAELDRRGGGDVDWFKASQPAREGDTAEDIVRLLPRDFGQAGAFWYKTYTHFAMGVDQQTGKKKRMPITCVTELDQSQGVAQPRPCAVCARAAAAEAMGDKATADALGARPRFFVNVLDGGDLARHQKVDAAGNSILRPAIATFGPGIMKKLVNIIKERGDITNPQTGRWVKIWTSKVGKEARDVRYDAIDASDNCPLPQGYENVQLVDLPTLDSVKEYDEVAHMLSVTYPGAGPGAMQPQPQQQAPAQQAQPPYQPPQGYQQPLGVPPQQAPQAQFQQPVQPPQAAQPPQQAPQAQFQPPQQQPAPQAAPVQQAAAPAPQAGPPGWMQDPATGQWVQTPGAGIPDPNAPPF